MTPSEQSESDKAFEAYSAWRREHYGSLDSMIDAWNAACEWQRSQDNAEIEKLKYALVFAQFSLENHTALTRPIASSIEAIKRIKEALNP